MVGNGKGEGGKDGRGGFRREKSENERQVAEKKLLQGLRGKEGKNERWVGSPVWKSLGRAGRKGLGEKGWG